MDFGWAINELKRGQKVTRTDWNRQRWLWMKPAAIVPAVHCQDPVLAKLAEQEEENGGISASATVCAASQGRFGFWHVTTGWTPQQEDMFADDWKAYKSGNDRSDEMEECEKLTNVVNRRLAEVKQEPKLHAKLQPGQDCNEVVIRLVREKNTNGKEED